MKNRLNGGANLSRIDFLRQKEREIRAALAAEVEKRAKRERRDTQKLDAILGQAVREAGSESADFRKMIAQTALGKITDEKQRGFLAARGWSL